MHHKYTTLGFLVHSRPSREADMLYSIYTEDFGMVQAAATSVRMSKSKLRSHVSVGVLLSVTLLKSKSGWRLVEVKHIGNVLNLRDFGYKIFAKILSVLRSLIHGEEKNESLFAVIKDLYTTLLSNDDQRIGEGIEMLGMIKVLGSLGYGANIDIGEYLNGEFDKETFEKIISQKKEVIIEINKSLKATGF